MGMASYPAHVPTPLERRYPLGRRVEHDPRSRAYPIPRLADLEAPPLHTVSWAPRTGEHVLDQGSVGACVAFTGGDVLNRRPLHAGRAYWDDQQCLRLYRRVTELDEFPGSWRPDGTGQDTGSSALGLFRALREAGEISRIEWAFGLQHTLEALQTGPVALGIPWRTAMFTPGTTGRIRYRGQVEGGHELAAFGHNVHRGQVWLLNHWSRDWGRNGWAWITPDDLGQALAEEGDAARLIR